MSGCVFDFDVKSQSSDSVGEVLGGAFGISGLSVVGSEVLVESSIFEPVINGAQVSGGDGDERFLGADASLETVVSGFEA